MACRAGCLGSGGLHCGEDCLLDALDGGGGQPSAVGHQHPAEGGLAGPQGIHLRLLGLLQLGIGLQELLEGCNNLRVRLYLAGGGEQVHHEAPEVLEQRWHAGRIHHQLAGRTLADLHNPLKDLSIVVEGLQGGDGHHLGDGTELEHGRVLEGHHVRHAVRDVLQRVHHHVVQAVEGRLPVLHLLECMEVVCVLGPDLLGPEHAGGLFNNVL
mmetsp:Transcript_36286/g.64942  ORF Transcript_36286/g.64942 Transcript_36286/m.64942 type:complete len:212 (-) Transcript_36286:713-1348(-)